MYTQKSFVLVSAVKDCYTGMTESKGESGKIRLCEMKDKK